MTHTEQWRLKKSTFVWERRLIYEKAVLPFVHMRFKSVELGTPLQDSLVCAIIKADYNTLRVFAQYFQMYKSSLNASPLGHKIILALDTTTSLDAISAQHGCAYDSVRLCVLSGAYVITAYMLGLRALAAVQTLTGVNPETASDYDAAIDSIIAARKALYLNSPDADVIKTSLTLYLKFQPIWDLLNPDN